MKLKAILTFTALCCFSHLFAQIKIPIGPVITVDGSLTSAEWTASDTVVIMAPGGNVEVLYQHDFNALNLAFTGVMESGGTPRFPEVLIDTQNDRATGFQADDWWFHVSGTDCEYQGQYGNYDSCETVRPNWTAVPNFTASLPNVDTVEIRIPLSTLSINSNDTIGASFLMNNFMSWNHWPTMAARQNPSTWQPMYFSNSLRARGYESPFYEVYPNPADDFVCVEGVKAAHTISLYSVLGKKVLESEPGLPGQTTRLAVHHLPEGIYILQVDIRGQPHKRLVRVRHL